VERAEHFAAKLIDKCLRAFSSWQALEPLEVARIMRRSARDLAARLAPTPPRECDIGEIASAALKAAFQASIVSNESWQKARRYLKQELSRWLALQA